MHLGPKMMSLRLVTLDGFFFHKPAWLLFKAHPSHHGLIYCSIFMLFHFVFCKNTQHIPDLILPKKCQVALFQIMGVAQKCLAT